MPTKETTRRQRLADHRYPCTISRVEVLLRQRRETQVLEPDSWLIIKRLQCAEVHVWAGLLALQHAERH